MSSVGGSGDLKFSLPKPVPFVEVEWDDAWGDSTEAVFPNDAHEKHEPFRVKTRGWSLQDDSLGMSLFSELCSDGSYRGRSFIPRAMIVGIIQLKLSKTRTKKEKEGPHEAPL